MWEIRNETPFPAERLTVVDKHGQRHWVVVVKATFMIEADGQTVRAEHQVPPMLTPEYRGEPGKSSLVYEQDLLAPKPYTDVYLNATAYAPNHSPCSEVIVEFEMPWASKRLHVVGDRVWSRNLMGIDEPGPPRPFLAIPIIYERAFGGYDDASPDCRHHRLHPENPIGVGAFSRDLPNIKLLGGSSKQTAGFGASCSYWTPRRDFQGTYDDAWFATQKPLLPLDHDPRNLQCAPLDQQAHPHLEGGETFRLTNLNPDRPLIVFRLPTHTFTFTTFIGERVVRHAAQIHTVVIEPDFPRVIVVWHSNLSCHHDIDDIDATQILEVQRG